ncbi:Uncharacterized protein dnm_049000 [Desulfonema magnum]|uniref:Uncharacterized protein n=1 Tax=Desulfonema magnum TaxID=45655 RepID=A0A975BNP4_9BACT|nr:Uncharacterized protein dnm_049000 [Desulfonema magnum]
MFPREPEYPFHPFYPLSYSLPEIRYNQNITNPQLLSQVVRTLIKRLKDFPNLSEQFENR